LQTIVSGADLIARAALDAGVNFFAGYPITPASSIYAAMLKNLQAEGKVALGVSDEISALSMCVGASMRGAKSLTASAAPGLSLMVETISYAFATETPVVIVVGQRLGPSTGAATQNAEGDISFVSNLIAGGYQIPVLAIRSLESAYRLTFEAVNTAEILRTPVILLTEKDLIMSYASFDETKLMKPEIKNRKIYNYDGSTVYKPYNFNALEDVPDFVAAGSQFDQPRTIVTGSMHDKAGNLSKNSSEALEVLAHHREKIMANRDKFLFAELSLRGAQQRSDAKRHPERSEGPPYVHAKQHTDTNIAIISFLATDLAVREALRDLESNTNSDSVTASAAKQSTSIKHLSLETLFPIPEELILETIKDCTHVIIPEENMSGQYAAAIKHLVQGKQVIKINSLAAMIKPKQILEAIDACL